MAVCQFFLEGRCRFGDRCWNEHPRGGGRYGPAAPQHQGTSGGGGGAWGTTNQRYTSVIQPSTFKSNTWGGSRDHGRGFFGSPDFGSSDSSSRNASFSQNRFSALMNSQNTADGYKDEEERLLESIVKDMEIWESSGQWIFSSYSPMKEKPNVSGFPDFSPEELHLEYYNCTANNNIQSYINSVQQLAKQWKDRLLQLKTLTASTKAALLSELKNTVTQPLPAFGFGGQQTSSFGLSSFPVSSNSNSASSFSFKTSSSLISTSSGNAPAFGSSSAGCNPPPFGVTSSPSVSHSVGFGSLAAPSAASFSFKTSETTSGFGTCGFSGFGNSSAVNFSGTTLLTALGASNAAVGTSSSGSSSTLFGQTASNAAVGTSSSDSSSTLSGQTASNAAVGTSSSSSSSTLSGQTASNAAVGTSSSGSSSTLSGQTASNAAVGTSSSGSSSTLFGQTASNAAVGTSSSGSSSTLFGQTASNAAVGTSSSDSSSTLFGQTASASGHNITSASSAVTNNTTSEKLFTPKSELSAEELKQFEARKFTIGKIPFKPPPSELLNV